MARDHASPAEHAASFPHATKPRYLQEVEAAEAFLATHRFDWGKLGKAAEWTADKLKDYAAWPVDTDASIKRALSDKQFVGTPWPATDYQALRKTIYETMKKSAPDAMLDVVTAFLTKSSATFGTIANKNPNVKEEQLALLDNFCTAVNCISNPSVKSCINIPPFSDMSSLVESIDASNLKKDFVKFIARAAVRTAVYAFVKFLKAADLSLSMIPGGDALQPFLEGSCGAHRDVPSPP